MNLIIVPIRKVDAHLVVVEAHDDYLATTQNVIARIPVIQNDITQGTSNLLKAAYNYLKNGSEAALIRCGDFHFGFVPEWCVPPCGSPAHPIHYTKMDWEGVLRSA